MADIGIKIKSDFKQAEKDFQSLASMSDATRAKIEKFQKSFTTEQIDKFIDKNKLNAIAIKATQGPIAGSRAEMMGLQREIQRLIRAGLSPESEAVRKLSTDFDRLQKEVGQTTQKSSIFGSVITGILGADIIRSGLSFLWRGFKSVVEAASDTENSLTQFTTMLGGSEVAAQRLVGQLQILGAQTPFEFQDLADATQMMIGFGAATEENVIDRLRMLGDVAQGNSEKLKSITLAFSQIQAAGKASMQDVNQLTNAGVPILRELAKMWGFTGETAIGQARAMVTSGRATSAEVTRAFQAMTQEGGMFFGGMIRSSTTFTGVMSTMQDSFTMTASAIGTKLLPHLKNAAIFVTEIANKFLAWALEGDNLINVMQTIAYTIGIVTGVIVVYKGAILAASLAGKAYAVMQGIMAVATAAYAAVTGAAAAGTGVLATAIKALTVAMALNPIGLIAVAVAALIVGIILLVRNFDTVKFYAVDFAQTAAIWMIRLGLTIYGSVIRMVGQLAGQLARLPGPIGRMFRGVQSGAQIAVGAMESARDAIIRNQAASRAAHAATLRRTAAETVAARRTSEASAASAEATTARVNRAARSRATTFKEMLEAMELSESAHARKMAEEATSFFTSRAEQEVEAGASRLEWLRAQYAAIDALEFQSAAVREAAATGLANAIVAEERRIISARVTFAQHALSSTTSLLTDLQTVFRNAGKESRALAYMLKAVAMGEAAINSYLAFTRVLSSPHLLYPMNMVAAGITLAAGLAKQAAIASTPIPKAETGIQDYRVPDIRSARNDRAAVMASPGESVTVTPRGESSGGRTEINIKIEEDTIFRVVTKGIRTGRIDISNRNLGSGVFPS